MKTRPAGVIDRQLSALWLAAAVSSLALKPLWLAVAPHLRPCIFHSLTGIACPSCGTTRAAVAFLDGNLLASFAANPLAMIAGFIFVAGAPVAMIWTLARLPIPTLAKPLPVWTKIVAVVLLLVNWIYVIVTL